MPDILLTNDDGYKSAGFLPLLKELSKDFSIISITPEMEKSWIGKAITTREKLYVKKVKKDGFEIHLLNGTPADCVQIGLYNILKEKPRMVVSGINLGSNVGHARILSSGTVGAAMEASIEKVKSIATSLRIPLEIKKTLDLFDEKNYYFFENAAKITAKLTKILIDKNFDEDTDLISINIPYDATLESDMEITRPFKDPYGQLFYGKGNHFIHRTPRLEFKNLKNGTDLKALSEGKISVTPLNLSFVTDKSLKNCEHDLKMSWYKE
ncbi:MAG: 5'/3'-nucleotidase SurE [Candidatus Thermoplasmatota archaeon]|nr:5'/3'-nucleotidase SurE [Candidatus Thermoplasmatota archaeon]